ncbi:tyrosine-type recombinase/integrase, partial [Escherichia coli]|nr:tyrosine-type recombinase/integrase [Escherichia coli]
WKGWAILLRQKQKKLIMLPSETMIWQPEFTDKTLSRKPGAVHPHMLRHACGFALADNGVDTRLLQDYLGHRNIQHTVRYTASNAARFKGVWKKKPR